MVTERYGGEAWQRVAAAAGLDGQPFVSSESYPDDLTYRLVGSACECFGLEANELLRAFGVFWIQNVAVKAYGSLLAATGRSFKDVLLYLPNLHSRIQLVYPHLRPPIFRCDDLAEQSIRLHYESTRAGLSAFVIGLVEGLAQEYNEEVEICHTAHKADGAGHDEYLIRWGAARG